MLECVWKPLLHDCFGQHSCFAGFSSYRSEVQPRLTFRHKNTDCSSIIFTPTSESISFTEEAIRIFLTQFNDSTISCEITEQAL